MRAVCYPIGLHWLVSLGRSLYTRLQHARVPEGWETLWRVRYQLGAEQGRREGYDRGLRHAQILIDTLKAPRG